MTLTGTYARSLDDKHRLAIPKRLREGFSGKGSTSLFIAPGTDRSLFLYAASAFEQLAERLAVKPSNRARVRNYLRMFYARAEEVDIDNQGRIRIPERLAEFAELQREVVLLGVQDHVEMWDRTLWEAFLEEHSADFDALAETAFD